MFSSVDVLLALVWAFCHTSRDILNYQIRQAALVSCKRLLSIICPEYSLRESADSLLTSVGETRPSVTLLTHRPTGARLYPKPSACPLWKYKSLQNLVQLYRQTLPCDAYTGRNSHSTPDYHNPSRPGQMRWPISTDTGTRPPCRCGHAAGAPWA